MIRSYGLPIGLALGMGSVAFAQRPVPMAPPPTGPQPVLQPNPPVAQPLPMMAPPGTVVMPPPGPAPQQPMVMPRDPNAPRPYSRQKRSAASNGQNEIYAGAGLGGRIFTEQHNDPQGKSKKMVNGRTVEETKIIASESYSLDTQFYLGWGPLHIEKLLFNAHYIYSQSWGSNADQAMRFQKVWFGEPSNDSFMFPTKFLIRTHEIAADFRFLDSVPDLNLVYSLGIFGRLELSRQGSGMIGDTNESAETIHLRENAVPYVAFQLGKNFRTQFWMPFFTDISKEDPSASYATYSWNSKLGRGRLFSFVSNNELLLPRIRSKLLVDGYLYQFKHSALALDYTRPGGAISFDFPVFFSLRLQPRLAYNSDLYYLKKVRIPTFLKNRGGYEESANEPAQEYKRNDVNYSFGGGAYIDIGEKRSHRLFFDFSQTQIVSTLQEYNGSTTLWNFGYKWAVPSVGLGERRINRFREGIYADSF